MQSDFKWGTLARAFFVALLWLIPLISWHAPEYLFYYIGLLIFLGLGLAPLLQATGLYALFSHYMAKREEKKLEKQYRKHRQDVALEERDKRYKRARSKDARLPKNW